MPTKAIARIENTYSWSEEQINLIREMCAKNCTDDEFKVLLYVADKYKLDPLTKQIYSQKYSDKPAAIIITYAGMQEIANRDGLLDGMKCTAIRNGQGDIIGAHSILWKKGCAHPFEIEVDFQEYYQVDRSGKAIGLWGTKPGTMIKKVANAQNLRQAFSLGQMYVEEEMPVVEAIEAEDEEVRPGLIQPKQTIPVIPAPTKTETPALSPDKARRIALGAEIDLQYNVRTVDSKGEWLNNLLVSDVYAVSFPLLGAKTFNEIKQKLNATDLAITIADAYPDAQTQAQKFAATIQYIVRWYKDQQRHRMEVEEAKERMAQDANANAAPVA